MHSRRKNLTPLGFTFCFAIKVTSYFSLKSKFLILTTITKKGNDTTRSTFNYKRVVVSANHWKHSDLEDLTSKWVKLSENQF